MKQESTDFPKPGPLPANPKTSIGRQHVESEQSLYSTADFPKSDLVIDSFCEAGSNWQQILSEDKKTGEYRLSHHIDLKTGFYNGKKVLDK